MAANGFTAVTRQNVFQRLGQSIKGVIFGLLLLVVAFPLLWWNEGRAVHRAQTLEQGRGKVVSILAEDLTPDAEGKLVHISGKAETDAVLRDPVFGVTAQALRLDREVQMYQWDEETYTETRTKLGGEKETVTRYEYVKRWAAEPIDSSRFRQPGGHDNPSMPYRDHTEWADDVSVGAYQLNARQIRRLDRTEPLPVSSDILGALPADLRGRAAMHGPGLYIGTDPGLPRVGDLKVRFAQAPPALITIVAQQAGRSFQPFQLKKGSIDELRYGSLTADEVFTAAEQENIVLTWILRGAGFLLMAIGLGTLFAPLAVIGDVIPILGSIMRFGIGIFSGVLAFALSLATIAVAWIAYRPLFGIGLLAVAIGSVILVRQLSGRKEPTPAAAGPRPGPPPAATGAPPPPPPPPPPPARGGMGSPRRH